MENLIFISDSFNPFFNLAFETVLFENASKYLSDSSSLNSILYLWRNEDTVVIGRYQNPWRECDVDKMKNDNVHLMRRYTGGGAVFHDANNICFSFINKKNCDEDAENIKKKNSAIICDALSRLGINAEISSRNDILVNGAKISGAAYKDNGQFFLHHGTILVGTDLDRLATYLHPDKRKLQSKGISSVRARVLNLCDLDKTISVESVSNEVCHAFTDFCGENINTNVTRIGIELLEKDSVLKTEYEKLKSWDWNLGKSPEFTHRFDMRFLWGGVDIQLNVKNAIIQSVEIFSDSLDTKLVDEIKLAITGIMYGTENICSALEERAIHIKKIQHSNTLATMLTDVASYISGAFANK